MPGNRTGLIYPDSRVVTYTYDMDKRLVQVEDWDGGLTGYEYDGIGRLITTTLPNQVIVQHSYDDAHHLTQLRYTGPGDTLLAEFQYQVDSLGQRQVVTETLLSPAYEEVIEAYEAANGLLVLEAENGLMTPGLNGQTWVSQTSQSGYAGASPLLRTSFVKSQM